MESSTICRRCYSPTKFFNLFSCHHALCTKCITRIVSSCHIKSIATQSQIQLTCPCALGTKSIIVADIPQLFSEYNITAICIKHNAAAIFYCCQCELWLCKACSEVHKVLNSVHQLTQGQICFRKCDIHDEQITDYYCHDCHEIICPLCTLIKGAKHFSHNSQLIKDYAKELRTHIPICDISAQVTLIEEMRGDFQRQVGNLRELTIKKIDQLIHMIDEFKLNYIEKMTQALQRGNLILNIVKDYYLNLNLVSQVNLDIHLLKDLSTWNMEFPKLELQDETEKRLRKIQEDFEEYKKLLIDTIHVDWIPRDWSKNTLTLIGHTSSIRSLIQMKDGRIASASFDNTIKIWEVKEKDFKNTLTLTRHCDSVYSLIQLKDGRLASGSADNTIKIWIERENTIMNTLTLVGHNRYVCSLIQIKDGRIVSGAYDKTIKVWEVKEKEFKNTLTLIGHNNSVYSLIQLDDGRIASGSYDKTIKVWEVKEKQFKNTLTLIGHNNSVNCLLQLKDGRIASGSVDMTIKIWEVKEKEFTNTLTLAGHSDSVLSLIQLKDGRIASGSDDLSIKVWEVKENGFKNTHNLIGHYYTVWSAIQLKDGRIASGSRDTTIKIWE